MRVAIIGDTHLPRGARRIPERCLDIARQADLLIHTGDFTALAVLKEFERLGPPLVAVHGNVDAPEAVARLPAQTSIEVERARLVVIHDAGPRRGRVGRLQRRFTDADAVVFGHSHVPLHEREGGFQIFNPGSPTERRRAPAHTMGLARIKAGEIHFEHLIVD